MTEKMIKDYSQRHFWPDLNQSFKMKPNQDVPFSRRVSSLGLLLLAASLLLLQPVTHSSESRACIEITASLLHFKQYCHAVENDM